jgi:hypothetical protein
MQEARGSNPHSSTGQIQNSKTRPGRYSRKVPQPESLGCRVPVRIGFLPVGRFGGGQAGVAAAEPLQHLPRRSSSGGGGQANSGAGRNGVSADRHRWILGTAFGPGYGCPPCSHLTPQRDSADLARSAVGRAGCARDSGSPAVRLTGQSGLRRGAGVGCCSQRALSHSEGRR